MFKVVEIKGYCANWKPKLILTLLLVCRIFFKNVYLDTKVSTLVTGHALGNASLFAVMLNESPFISCPLLYVYFLFYYFLDLSFLLVHSFFFWGVYSVFVWSVFFLYIYLLFCFVCCLFVCFVKTLIFWRSFRFTPILRGREISHITTTFVLVIGLNPLNVWFCSSVAIWLNKVTEQSVNMIYLDNLKANIQLRYR